MTFNTTNPYTNQIIKSYQYDSFETAMVKVDLARQQQKIWSYLSLAERIQILKKISEKFVTHADVLAAQMCLEMGKPIRQAQDEIRKCVDTLSGIQEVAERVMVSSTTHAHYNQVVLSPEPYGLVLSVQPWNFPFWQVVRMAVGALVAGNLVLLKHSDLVAGCAEILESLFSVDDFKLVVNLVLTHEDTLRVLADPKINMLTFTGSVDGGSIVAAQAARHLKKSVLELGGSDAYLVLQDADIDLAVSLIIKSRFLNSGQSCICAKRVFVHESISVRFKNELLEKIKKLNVGDPSKIETDIGPLAHLKFVEQIRHHIAAAEKIGGVFHGVEFAEKYASHFSPIGLIDFNSKISAFQDIEIFGPVLAFYTFLDVEPVLEVINSGPFGLGGGVFSADPDCAHKLAKKINVGTVVINNFVQTGVKVPFGGRRKSGYGYELGEQGLNEFINWKVIAC